MDLNNRSVIIGVNIRDIENPLSAKHLFVDVVLIDKSHEILHPLLYQLKNDALRANQDLEQLRRNGYVSLDHNAFAMVGEVLEFDKKKKQIHLKNNDTVTYKHLILATGLKQTHMGSVHDEELSVGFHTLSEALRINKNTDHLRNSVSFEHLRFNTYKPHTLSSQAPSEEVTIQNLIKTLSTHDYSKSLNMTLAGTNRRLYEVQL
jgi:NADH dehydrogenase FAD-containing subunit